MKLVDQHVAHFGMLKVRAAETPMVILQKYTAVGSYANKLSAKAATRFRTQ